MLRQGFAPEDHLTTMTALLTTFLFAQTLVVAPVDLAAVAAASPRPTACASAPGSLRAHGTLWDRARAPEQHRFCAELARGYASLTHAPRRALAAAAAAEQQWSGQADPLVLSARAELALGDLARAHQTFEQALKLDPHCLRDPSALHDRARAATAVGEFEIAAVSYRQLVPRVGLVPSVGRRTSGLIEAAVLAMHEGAAGLDEALGYLGEARRRPRVAGAEGYLLGTLALALDRQGRQSEARGVAAEAGGPWGVARRVPLPDDGQLKPAALSASIPLLPPHEAYAIVALLAEADHPDVAREYWRASVQATDSSGAWREYATGRLAMLSGR
jgi:tetratricopeptide (TPR) repeat protein